MRGIKLMSSNNKLTADLRDQVIKEIKRRITYDVDYVEFIDDILMNGHKGLNNMSDDELYQEYKQSLEGYDLLKEMEVELAIEDLLTGSDKK